MLGESSGRHLTRDFPVRAVDRDGVVTTTDGGAVRVIALTPRATGSDTETELQLISAGLERLLRKLPPEIALQWYVESRRVPVTGDHLGSPPRSTSIERSIHVLVREPAPRRSWRSTRAEQLRRLLLQADGMRSELMALGLKPRLVDGPGVSRVLLRRIRSALHGTDEQPIEVVGSLETEREREQARAAATRLLDHLGTTPIDFAGDSTVQIGSDLEQTIYLGGPPSETTAGWPRALLATSQPHVLSIHARAREDGELDIGIYLTFREAGPTPDRIHLAATVDAAVGAPIGNAGARFDRCDFFQRDLWPATLPLALHDAGIVHPVDARVAADSLPVAFDGCGSPDGVPVAVHRNGTPERLDPWDAVHRHAGIAVAGRDPDCTRAMLTLVAAFARAGATVVVADLTGRIADAAPGVLRTDVQVVDAANPKQLADLADCDPVLVLDARASGDPLATVGTAAALLAHQSPATLAPASDGEREGRGILVVDGADRLVADAAGAEWLRRAAARARRDGSCVVATAPSLLALVRAEAHAVLPIRLLVGHPAGDVPELRDRLRLTAAETTVLTRGTGDADGGLTAVWLNGDRGRSAVELTRAVHIQQVGVP